MATNYGWPAGSSSDIGSVIVSFQMFFTGVSVSAGAIARASSSEP